MSSLETLILPSVQPWVPGDSSVLCTEIQDRLPDADVRTVRHVKEARDAIRTADILVGNEFPSDLLDTATQVQWIQVLSAGVSKYPVDQLKGMDVLLTNVSGIHAEPIAEQVLGSMLVFERRLLRGIRQQYDRRWERYYGGELRSKTVGIIGLGSIGQRIAELSAAFSMTVLGTKRTPELDDDAVDELYGPEGLYEVLSRSDYVVLSCPLTDVTRGLLQRSEFNAMKSSAVLVNVARGAIVDESDLTEALQNRRIRGAALDVFEDEPLPPASPLWNLSNVLITPHTAGMTPFYLERCADIFAENYQKFTEGDRAAMTHRIL